MNPIPRRVIENSLSRKGFRKKDNPVHRYYYFYYDDKKYPIHTKISHGNQYKEYGTHLIKLIKMQLKLDTNKQTEDLLWCPMKAQDYIDLLIAKGELPGPKKE
jgi:hypothetical protein